MTNLANPDTMIREWAYKEGLIGRRISWIVNQVCAGGSQGYQVNEEILDISGGSGSLLFVDDNGVGYFQIESATIFSRRYTPEWICQDQITACGLGVGGAPLPTIETLPLWQGTSVTDHEYFITFGTQVGIGPTPEMVGTDSGVLVASAHEWDGAWRGFEAEQCPSNASDDVLGRFGFNTSSSSLIIHIKLVDHT